MNKPTREIRERLTAEIAHMPGINVRKFVDSVIKAWDEQPDLGDDDLPVFFVGRWRGEYPTRVLAFMGGVLPETDIQKTGEFIRMIGSEGVKAILKSVTPPDETTQEQVMLALAFVAFIGRMHPTKAEDSLRGFIAFLDGGDRPHVFKITNPQLTLH